VGYKQHGVLTLGPFYSRVYEVDILSGVCVQDCSCPMIFGKYLTKYHVNSDNCTV